MSRLDQYAADPAPAQPDEALSDDEREALDWVRRFLAGGQITDLGSGVRLAVTRVADALDRLAARATQPVPAPEVSRGVAEATQHRVIHDPGGNELVCSCGFLVTNYGSTRSLVSLFAQHVRDALPAEGDQ